MTAAPGFLIDQVPGHRYSGLMRPTIFALSLALSLAACQRAAKAPAAKVRPPLPVVAITDIPAPASASVVVKPGMNLREVGAGAYGHERFSGFVAVLNDIPNPEQIAVGITLKTPSLALAFQDAGLDPKYQPDINALAKACTDFREALPAYLEAREKSGGSAGTFAIPAESKKTFLECADAIDAARYDLDNVKSPHKIPRKTIDQVAQASFQLRELATGAIDGYGYDHDLVGQRFGLGFTNALIWTRDRHQ